MYIKYELYRTKNQELFNSGAIEWVLKTDKDLIEIDRRIFEVLTYHISELPEIKKSVFLRHDSLNRFRWIR